MTTQQKCRAAWAGGHRLKIVRLHNPKRPHDDGQRLALEVGADTLLARCVEAGRYAVAAGWNDPAGYHNAACEHGLRGNMFADPICDFLHGVLCAMAEQGWTPNVDLTAAVARDLGVDLEATELLDCLIEYTPTIGIDLDDLVAAVTYWSRRRIRAQRHLRAFLGLVDVSPTRMALPLYKRNGKQQAAEGSWLRSNNHAR